MPAEGKYDEVATIARGLAGAEGVLLAVLNGSKGSGFSIQLPPEKIRLLPPVLRNIADQIEQGMAAGNYTVENDSVARG